MKSLAKYILLIAIFLGGFISSSKGQYNQPLSDYVMEVWSAEEGLPSNNLRNVAKDNDGFLWISTFNGLVRFDGVKFKTFDSEDIPELVTSAFYSVISAPNGDLMIHTQSSGIILYSEGGFSQLPNTEKLPVSVQNSFFDKSGRHWIGTRNNGIYYLENGILSKFSIPSFDTKSIMKFTEDNAGNIWVASEGAGIAKINANRIDFDVFTVENGLVSNIVNTILCHDRKIYVGTEKGLSIFDYNNWSVDDRLSGFSINDIIDDASSNLWFAADNGLARILQNNKFEYITENDGLPARQVSSVAFDNESNIWLSTKRGGLVQLKLSSFKNITVQDGLHYRGVNVIEESPKNTYYIGSDNGDLDRYEEGKISRVILKKNLANVSIKDVLAENDGTLWVATYDGVIKKKGNKEEYFTVDQGLLSNKTRRIMKDSQGIVWIASRNGGLNKINKDNSMESISVNEGLGSDFVFSVNETPDGRIVVGTANGGLNIIHKNGSIDIFKPDSLIVGLSIFNVLIESNDRFWLATNVGLYCFENNNFTLISVKNGLPVETFFDVKEDSNGNLWLSSILGVVRVLKSDVVSVVNGEKETIVALLLNDSDGMVSRECTGATRFLLALDGKFWIPTIKGVTILDPLKLILNSKEPQVFIEEILVDDETVDWQKQKDQRGIKSVVIGPGHRNYVINYTSLSMYSPEKVKFSYKLEGFDEDWIEIGPTRSAKYTNIPYGHYTFKVNAANNNGVWSAQFAELDIIIEPYIYETTWFIALLIIIFVFATFLIYSFQTKEVNARNKELTKLNGELDSFAYSVSHDLKAPLSSIQGLLNLAKLEGGENAMEYYTRIGTSVTKLDGFIKDIIDYSKNARLEVRKEFVNVKELVLNVLDGLAYVNKENAISIDLFIDENVEILTDKTRFLFIVNNLLTNAYRYADFDKQEPFIKVSANVIGQSFSLDIEDNGQGIKKELQARIYEMFYRANEKSEGSGLGLYIVKESLVKLNGTIKINSEFEIGTTVKVKIPL